MRREGPAVATMAAAMGVVVRAAETVVAAATILTEATILTAATPTPTVARTAAE